MVELLGNVHLMALESSTWRAGGSRSVDDPLNHYFVDGEPPVESTVWQRDHGPFDDS